ncbi:MAG: SEL1-like repeat protein [Alphaproteobacteria bacterium]|nr:SEL1-like repeat protein [Alphaproteobacteria bacterium]
MRRPSLLVLGLGLLLPAAAAAQKPAAPSAEPPVLDCRVFGDAQQRATCGRANERNRDALFAMGFAFSSGTGVARDYLEAARLYRLASDLGHGTAANNLAVLYGSGFGVPRDDQQALRFYRLGAERGDPFAQTNLAAWYRDGRAVTRDDGEAVRLLRLAVAQNHPLAFEDLGYLIENGRGAPRNEGEARSLYARAAAAYRQRADRGEALYRYNYGRLLELGRGVAQDYAAAAEYYRLALRQGETRAARPLAYLHITGRGVARDWDEALRLYRAEAERGDVPSMNSTAWYLAILNRNLDEAQTLVERALRAAPDNINYLDTRAFILLRRGDAAAALPIQLRVVASSEAGWMNYDILGDIYAALGRTDEARTAWQRALDMSVNEPPHPYWDRQAIITKLTGGAPPAPPAAQPSPPAPPPAAAAPGTKAPTPAPGK